jgi:molecular chaperone GrpE (heat shock protein)
MQDGAVYQGVVTLQKTLLKDLNKLWVDAFQCIWKIIDPELHEVMTQVPWEEGIIIDEFEKGYLISGRVLRVAKVVAWNGQ